MNQKPCIFCQIIRGAVLSKIVYEDENVLAFLDINPRSKGMTIVVPKQHYKEFDENFELSVKVFSSALIVAEMIKLALQPKKIYFSIMVSDMIPHFHIKIYPVFEKEMPLIEGKPIFMNELELESIAQKIRGIKVEVKKEEKKEETKEEKKEEEEKEEPKRDVSWLKRELEIA